MRRPDDDKTRRAQQEFLFAQPEPSPATPPAPGEKRVEGPPASPQRPVWPPAPPPEGEEGATKSAEADPAMPSATEAESPHLPVWPKASPSGEIEVEPTEPDPVVRRPSEVETQRVVWKPAHEEEAKTDAIEPDPVVDRPAEADADESDFDTQETAEVEPIEPEVFVPAPTREVKAEPEPDENEFDELDAALRSTEDDEPNEHEALLPAPKRETRAEPEPDEDKFDELDAAIRSADEEDEPIEQVMWTPPPAREVEAEANTAVGSTAVGSTSTAWIVLAFIALLYIGVSFAPAIFDDNEGLYAGAVREMHAAHNWLVPLSNGFPRVQKPPLVYWSMLASTSVLGENEFALRLPNALATVGWIVATFLVMRRLGGERHGLAAAAALASMLGVWIFTHLVQPEPFLACFVSLAFWCLVEARAETAPRARWYVLFWVFIALGTMSKGLHGALWPLGVVVLLVACFPTWRRTLRPLLDWRGIALFLLITVPWYAYMAEKFPHFLSAHFLNEQMGAALSTRYPSDAKQLSLFQFYAQHLLFWMPWTLLFPGAIWAMRRVMPSGKNGAAWTMPEVDTLRLLACWVIMVMVSVAFSMRQDYYSMACWGVIAGLLVHPWTLRQAGGLRVPRWFLLGPCLLLALVGLAALGFGAWLAYTTATANALAAPIAQRDTFMDALAGISPALWRSLLPLFFLFGLALISGGAIAGWYVGRARNYAALLVLAVTMAVPVVLATRGFAVMSPYFSLQKSAQQINAALAQHPDALVACEDAPNTASSLLYYLNARVHWVNAPFDNQYAQRVLGQGHDYYWDEPALDTAWGKTPVYLIVEDDRLAYWQRHLAHATVLTHDGTRDVLVNR